MASIAEDLPEAHDATMKNFRAIRLLLLAAMVLSLTPTASRADSWALPTTTTYTSRIGHARVIVTPRNLESQLRYFEDKVGNVDPAGQKKGAAGVAKARLERRVEKRWHVVWERQIANDVAPVSMLVQDDGEHAVTFDDWHGLGYGPNAVVVYGADGQLVRALTLSDIVPAAYIEALPHSVSSIHWRGEPRFSTDGRRVLIPLVIPSEEFRTDPTTIDFAIDLESGTVSPIDPTAWQAALATGRRIRATQIAWEAAAKVAFLASLVGPKVNAEREWHDYLREAVGRLIGDDDTPSTTVLRKPGVKDYAISETWVHDALTESYADKVALASMSELDLVSALERIASKLPVGSLSRVTVFVAVSCKYWPDILATMQRSGAKLVQLDPAKDIPQRPERIARRYSRD